MWGFMVCMAGIEKPPKGIIAACWAIMACCWLRRLACVPTRPWGGISAGFCMLGVKIVAPPMGWPGMFALARGCWYPSPAIE